MANILFLIPQGEIAENISRHFMLAGHQLDVAYTLEAAQALLAEISADVLLLDSLFCGKGEGVDFILRAKSTFPQLVIILSVCADDQAIVYELLSVGIITSWIKDAFQNEDLLSIVENILHKHRPLRHPAPFPKLPERRNSPHKEVDVSVRWRNLGDLQWNISYARNMSLGGLMLETDGKLTLPQDISLEISLPSPEVPIQAGGEVRWVRWDEQQNKQQHGIQLVDLDEANRIRLLDYLSGIIHE